MVVAGGCWRLLAVTGVPVLERFCTHLARNCQLLGTWQTHLISEWFLAVTGGYWRLLVVPGVLAVTGGYVMVKHDGYMIVTCMSHDGYMMVT